jgi:hypothetical protein
MDGIDVDAACRSQYGRSDAYGHASSVDDAYSWACYRRAPSPSTVGQLEPVSYTTFDGHAETLVPWQGEKVAVLAKAGVSRDAGAMTRLVSALDRAYQFYAEATGRKPTPYFALNGRDTIAEVSTTCGAGCGYLGQTGVEVAEPYFESMYSGVAEHDQYDQIPFYELGRNFYFYGGQLGFPSPDVDPVGTGYAVWMRFESMAAAVVTGDATYENLRNQVASLVDVYENDPSKTFADTLAKNQSPGAYNGTDFWASLMMRLASRYGGSRFISRFLQKVAAQSSADSTAAAVSNWQQAASFAACADLASVFYTRWGFPRPDGSVSLRPPAETVPWPSQNVCEDLAGRPPQPSVTGDTSGQLPTNAPAKQGPSARCIARRHALSQIRRQLGNARARLSRIRQGTRAWNRQRRTVKRRVAEVARQRRAVRKWC